MELTIPWLGRMQWILLAFVLAAILFDVLLVRVWPLTKVGWKRVDYVWLSFGLLAVVGGVASSRQSLATGMVPLSEARLDGAARWVVDRLAFGRDISVCRTFVRSEYSPPPEDMARSQKEFDALCAWFRAAPDSVVEYHHRNAIQLSLADFGSDPPATADPYAVSSLREAIESYNAAIAEITRLRAASERYEREWLLDIFSPLLLALALALRITKATGEIRLERVKENAANSSSLTSV